MVTLQLQSAWGWSPALASIGVLPQIIVLLFSDRLVAPFRESGMNHAAGMSATAVLLGLAVFAAGSRFGYIWIAPRPRPRRRSDAHRRRRRRHQRHDRASGDRTTIGAAMGDTSSKSPPASG